jgi:cell division protease FtsH
MEMLVGMWAAKVRDLFGKAKAAGRAIIFIDEIDAIWKKRWIWHTWWHQEQEQTLNQILTEMDGFDNTTNIIVIAATNRPDTLDPALMRAWRFDRKVYVSEPNYDERILILNYYLSSKKLDVSVNIPSLAKRTSGLVGADIENIVNEAALKEAKENRTILSQNDFEYALEKVIMWPEKKVKSMKEQEKKIIAFHELWHAITSHFLPNADPVEKISIVRRWHALWVTWIIPNEDLYLNSKAKFLDEVVSLLWWRAAEEVFFGVNNITTWASNDFEKATSIITNMIVKYGMDKEMWPVSYVERNDDEYRMFKSYSEKTAQIIDEKIKKYLANCYEKSKKLITQNKQLIEKLSLVLLDKEYLTKEEFESMITKYIKSKKAKK